MNEPMTHQEFMSLVQKHLAERQDCAIMVLVKTPTGLEIQTNFMDFILSMGMLDIAKMITAVQFDQSVRSPQGKAEIRAMTEEIRNTSEGKKNEVN